MAQDLQFKILSDNRQAGHNYFLLERFEAGMVLTGTGTAGPRLWRVRYTAIIAVWRTRLGRATGSRLWRTTRRGPPPRDTLGTAQAATGWA